MLPAFIFLRRCRVTAPSSGSHAHSSHGGYGGLLPALISASRCCRGDDVSRCRRERRPRILQPRSHSTTRLFWSLIWTSVRTRLEMDRIFASFIPECRNFPPTAGKTAGKLAFASAFLYFHTCFCFSIVGFSLFCIVLSGGGATGGFLHLG